MLLANSIFKVYTLSKKSPQSDQGPSIALGKMPYSAKYIDIFFISPRKHNEYLQHVFSEK